VGDPWLYGNLHAVGYPHNDMCVASEHSFLSTSPQTKTDKHQPVQRYILEICEGRRGWLIAS